MPIPPALLLRFYTLVQYLETALAAGLSPDDLTRAVRVAVQQYGDALYQCWRAGGPDVHAEGIPPELEEPPA